MKKIQIEISNIDENNKKDKFQKAIKTLAKELNIPTTIEQKENHKEQFPFKAQEELYEEYKNRFGLIMDDLYSRISSTLGIRPVTTFKKSIDPKAPKIGKEILWNPETGKPITDKEMDRLLNAIDKFMNKNVDPMKGEFVISQAAVSRMLANLRKNNSFESLRERELDSLKYKNKKWDTVKTYSQLNEMFPANYDRLKFRERVVGNYITDVSDKTRNGIRNILDEGFLAGKTKGEISQELFDKFGSLNKDWDRIVDTEGVNVFNAEFIEEEKRDVLPGEALYFIRREYNDNKTCNFCIKATESPIIAKWSDVPLQDDKIKDPVASIALWESKTNIGRNRADWWWAEGSQHPYCRGAWDRYDETIGDLEL